MGRVLVIDDEKMVCDLVAQALAQMNHAVDTVGNGLVGMAQFDSQPYDLVITDVRLPGVDGYTVVNHIRHSQRCRTPVIGVSGTPALLNDGAFDDTLCKPFPLKTLIDKVASLTRAGAVGHAGAA